MKKKLFTLASSAMIMLACSSSAKETGAKKATQGDEIQTENIKMKRNIMGTIKLTKADFLTKIFNYEAGTKTWKYEGNKPAIIDFYADWCGPCKQIAPLLEELAEEYCDEIYIYKVDVDAEEELAALYNIRNLPSMLFIPMEGQPRLASGAAPKADLKKAIESLLLAKED